MIMIEEVKSLMHLYNMVFDTKPHNIILSERIHLS
jgi:hypothetical protein